ncbi:iron dicitrate transport regulator FecR [Chitinophaga caeni]|uniref:Iron dicitrate transport regulator FecR n=1 Tax=Chitinophaga caeni TaxID=2029983 RepID=A0A291QT04_9BACT|nr:FecR family protein [Chitinophaga caeni]ATL47002.1 iron dicitrate transport regulator FecR [Chitinophaga caeni]
MLSEKDKIYLRQVLERYETGRATPEEIHFVEVYMDYLDELHKDVDPLHNLGAEGKPGIEQEIKERLFESIHNTPVPVINIHRRPRFTWQAAAAIIFVILGAATTWILYNQYNKHPSIVAMEDVGPGAERAVLKLGNGRVIMLDTSRGNIVQSGGLTVANDSGILNYQGKAAVAEYHTLSVPRGGQYKLQLPDGTDVWLNAASSITYPTFFDGSERLVKVTGEVYFEVAQMAGKPFRVKSPNGSDIQVLGTRFNINSYADEPTLKATLLEGAIRFNTATEHQVMKPGQQAILNKSGSLEILSNVNTEAVTAWRKGYFYFDATDLQTVMRQIARWYDVTVTYEGEVPDMKFSGEISKSNNISLVLEMLKANNIRFEIKGRKIIVKP